MTDQPKEELTTDKARELLQKEQRENQLKCQVEIQAVLDKYGMQIQGFAIVQASQINIVPK